MDVSEAQTANWVERSRRGDAGAFTQLINQYERQALATAYGIVGCAATAADVVQDAMVRAWQRLGELDDGNRFAPWLCRIVRNLAVDTLRRAPRARADMARLAAVPVPADNSTERNETRQQLHAAIAELDELTRLVVTFRYYDNLSSRQIGEMVGLSPAAVDMRLSRGRSVLREKLSCLLPDEAVTCPAGGSGTEVKP